MRRSTLKNQGYHLKHNFGHGDRRSTCWRSSCTSGELADGCCISACAPSSRRAFARCGPLSGCSCLPRGTRCWSVAAWVSRRILRLRDRVPTILRCHRSALCRVGTSSPVLALWRRPRCHMGPSPGSCRQFASFHAAKASPGRMLGVYEAPDGARRAILAVQSLDRGPEPKTLRTRKLRLLEEFTSAEHTVPRLRKRNWIELTVAAGVGPT